MDNIGDQLARIRTADQGKPRKNVLILGAGMAGLAAAYELVALGHTVSVIEASSRVGGRVMTYRFSDGQYHELGAMRIPANHDYTRHYIDVVGLTPKLRRFITANENKNCFYYIRGKVARIREASKSLLREYRLSAHERMLVNSNNNVPPAIFGAHLSNTLKSLSPEDQASLFGESFLTDRAASLESETLGSFLDHRLESKDAKELIGATTGLEVWWEIALSMFLRDEIVGTGDGLQEIAGGMDLLPQSLADKLGRNRIRFNTEVVSIALHDTGVMIRTRPTDASRSDQPIPDEECHEEKADFVICSIPFSVLRSVELSHLSYLKMLAIRNLNYTSSTKVLLHCKERFWERGPAHERIVGGASLSDQITRSTYYPSDHASPAPAAAVRREERAGFRGLFTAFLQPFRENTYRKLR
jgi:monoamine oxidase